MAERTLHATLKKRLINNEAFAYAHLIKYERPHPPLANGKHSTDAKRYAYLTDAAINIDFNDASLATNGTANGSQTYIADKIFKIGSYSETIESKATGMTLELAAESLNNSITSTSIATSSSTITVPTSIDLVEEGFREGDKIRVSFTNLETTDGTHSVGDFGLNVIDGRELEFAIGDIITAIGSDTTRYRVFKLATGTVFITQENDTSKGLAVAIASGALNISKELEVKVTGIKTSNTVMTIANIDSTLIAFSSGVSTTLKIISDELKGPLTKLDNNTLKSYHNRDVFVYKAFLDPDDLTILGAPILIFKGIITSADIEDKPNRSLRVKWSLTSHWGDFVQVNGRLTDDSVHRALDNTGKPQPEVARKEIYATDLGFAHSEETINILATYKVMETKQKLVKKKKWFGLSKKYKMVEYQEEVNRDVDLNFSLSAKYIPIVYGVDRLQGVPVFVDTKSNDPNNIYIAYSLCEGEIGGIYDLYIEDSPLICQNKEDFDDRNLTNGTSKNEVDIVCRGRADLGDTLGGVKISGQGVTGSVNTIADPSDSYAGFGRNGWRDIYDNVNRWNNYFRTTNKSLLNTNSTADGKGVVDIETISVTKPNTMRFTVHTGATDQLADDTLSEIAKTPGFKRQNDYYDGDVEDYWGPNHILSDTAYVVLDCEIGEDATTVPEVEYVVRGKYVNCYNYDYSYLHNPVSTYSSESANNFSVGDTVDLKDSDGVLLHADNEDVFIIDKWTIIGEGGVLQTRFRFSDAPNLTYVDGIPTITNFYMEKTISGTNPLWHMVTTRNTEESGTVPSKLSATASAVTAPTDAPTVVTIPSSTPWIDIFPYWKDVINYLSIAFIENGRGYQNFAIPVTHSVSGTTLTVTGGTGSGAVTGSQEIISKNSIKLATSASDLDDFYNGMKLEMTIIDQNGDYSLHSRIISDYDGGTETAQIGSIWDNGFEPKANDDWTYTYKIIAPRDKRVSINPAMQLLDYATSDTYGKGLINDLDDTSRSDISLSDWLLAARVCDGGGTQTLNLVAGTVATAGQRFVLTSDGTTSGSIVSMGRVRTSILDTDTSVIMEECFNKFSKSFMKNNHAYVTGDIIANSYGYYRVLSGAAGAITTEPTHTSGTTNNLQFLSSVPIHLLSQSGGATVISSTTLSLKKYTNPTYSDYTTYSLYNSDFVRYWRYLGWEDHHQRWVSRHQTCGVVDTSNSTFDNINGFLKQFNGMLSFEAGKYALRIATTSDGGETIATVVSGNSGSGHTYEGYTLGSQANIRYIEEQDIIGSIKVKDPGPKKAFNTINSTISDPGNKFSGKSVSFYDSNFLKSDKNVIKQGSHSQPSVTSYFNARINVENALRKSRFNMTVSFKLGPKALLLLTGQTIGITHSKFGWSAKKFRVTNISFNTNCTASVTAEEYDDSFYTILTPSLPSVLNEDFRAPVEAVPGTPSSLTATAGAIGTIDLVWVKATGVTAANETEIWVNTSNSQYGTILTTVAGDVIGFTHAVGSDNATRYYWVRHKKTIFKGGKNRILHGAYHGSANATTVIPSSFYGVKLSADAQIFNANSSGTIQSPATITFTSQRDNLSAATVFTTNNSGTNVSLSGSGDTRTLSIAQMGSVTTTVVTATVTSTTAERTAGADNTYAESATISVVLAGGVGAGGDDAKTVHLTAADYSIVYDLDGANPDPAAGNMTLTATSQNFTNGYFKFTGDGLTDQTSFSDGTGANVDIHNFTVPSSYFSSPKTVRVGVAEAAADDVEIAFDTITIHAVKPGATGGTGLTGAGTNFIFARQTATPPTPTANGLNIPSASIQWYDDPPTSPLETLWSSKGTVAAGGTAYVWGTVFQVEGDAVAELRCYSDVVASNGSSPTKPSGSTYNVTNSTLTLNDSNWNLTPPSVSSNGDTVYSCTVLVSGAATATAIAIGSGWSTPTIYARKTDGSAGVDGMTFVITNSSHTFQATSAGAVSDSYAGSGTIIEVYEGATLLVYDGTGTANSRWKTTDTATNITVGTKSVASNSLSVDVHSGVADGTDTSKIVYAISGKRAAGTSFSTTVQQSFSKSKAGASVTGAAGLRTIQGYLYYEKTSSGAPPAPEVAVYNFTNGDITDGGSGTDAVSDGGTTNVWRNSPRPQDATSDNYYWTVRYFGTEASAGSANVTVAYSSIVAQTTFAGVVTFSGGTFDIVGGSNITTIDGSNITTGAIKSASYDGPGTDGSAFSTTGTKFTLSGSEAGAITSEQFRIDTDGNATFGGTMSVGTDDAIFIASGAGIQLGDATFADADFSVTPAGILKVGAGVDDGYLHYDPSTALLKLSGKLSSGANAREVGINTAADATTLLFAGGSNQQAPFYVDENGNTVIEKLTFKDADGGEVFNPTDGFTAGTMTAIATALQAGVQSVEKTTRYDKDTSTPARILSSTQKIVLTSAATLTVKAIKSGGMFGESIVNAAGALAQLPTVVTFKAFFATDVSDLLPATQVGVTKTYNRITTGHANFGSPLGTQYKVSEFSESEPFGFNSYWCNAVSGVGALDSSSNFNPNFGDTAQLDAGTYYFWIEISGTGPGSPTSQPNNILPGTVPLPQASRTLNVSSGSTFYIDSAGAGSSDPTTYSAGNLLDLNGTIFNVDLSEATDGTAAIVGADDEIIYLDDGSQKRKAVSEWNLGQFNNDQSWTPTQTTVSGLAGSATVLATARTIGGTSFDGSANIAVALATLATTATVTDSNANTDFPVVFHNESNGLLDDTTRLRYNPSTGTLLAPNLVVAGTTTTVDTVTMNAQNAIIFEGATANDYETTLSIVDPTADHTQYLINQGGYIPVLAAATTTAITSTPAEINLLDALDIGSILYGNSSGVTAVLGQGSADQVLTSDGTNIAWQDVASGSSGTVDTSGSPVDNDFAKFTDANTIEGRSYSEVRSDLNVADGATANTGTVDTTGTVNANEFARFTDGNTLAALTYAETRTALNVADGATADQTAISGNAGTATALATARTIGGVSFDGTANINLPGVNAAGNQATSGLAATATLAASATILANTRTIGGVSFNGSANINLPGVNTAGNQNTSGTAATVTTAAQSAITSLGTLTSLTGGTGDLNWDSGTLFVDSSANEVGIGTTSPGATLDVKSQINVMNSENVSLPALKGTRFGYSTSYKVLQIGSAGTTTSDNIAIGVDLSTNSNGSFTGSGEALYFRNGIRFRTPNSANDGWHELISLKDGKVGINDITPSYTLDVAGTTQFTGNSLIGGTLDVTGAITGNLTGNASGTAATVTTAAQPAITSVGTLTSLAVGYLSISAGTIVSANLNGNIDLTPNGTGDINLNKDTSVTGDVTSTGNITAYYSSDIALKENLIPIPNAVNKVMSISGYNFDWKDTYIKSKGGEDGYFVKKSDIGIVAQEIEKILPEAVAVREDGTKGVRYEQIIPLLIEAIKELKEEVDTLKEK